ncbi:MAG: YunC family protein [Bacillota bacterium]
MINVIPMQLEKGFIVGIQVSYPKTTLLSLIVPNVGYVMCGVLNIEALDFLHGDREIIACRTTGVKTLEDVLHSKVQEITKKAFEIGIEKGMNGKEALMKMIEHGGHCTNIDNTYLHLIEERVSNSL